MADKNTSGNPKSPARKRKAGGAPKAGVAPKARAVPKAGAAAKAGVARKATGGPNAPRTAKVHEDLSLGPAQHSRVLPDGPPEPHGDSDYHPPLASLYGLTPRVEAAVYEAIDAGSARQVRALVAPLHSADQADLLTRTPSSQMPMLLGMLGEDFHYDTLNYLDRKTHDEVVAIVGTKEIAHHLSQLSSDDAVHIVEELQPGEIDTVLAELSRDERELIEAGLSFHKNSAGRLMQREMVTVPGTWNVGQAVDYMRASSFGAEEFYVIFVVDQERHVIGDVNVGKLLCAERDTEISDIMDTDVHFIPCDMDHQEVAALFRRYGMVSAPVLDVKERIIGVITVDDVVDVIDKGTEAQINALARVGDSNLKSGIMKTIRGRGSWLFVNLLTAILASVVIGLFDKTIEQLVALAVLMPIVASMGGNAGTQTVTVAVRAIALRQLEQHAARQFVIRELLVATFNGVVFAIMAAALSFVWFGDVNISTVMAVAMMANMVVAGLGGTMVPLGLVKLGVDPAIASSVFITTITDVVGFFVFLGLAALYLI